jgi:ElaB/YqjD/DUF883 family membrane-anchored ribosome-binding protein
MTTMNERVETMDRTVRAGATAAGEEIAAVAGQAQQMAHQQFDRLADTIRARPLQATGIAAGIGFALALLARR